MNRKDIAIVAALLLLIVFWPRIDQWIVRRFYPERLAPRLEERSMPSMKPSEQTPVGQGDRMARIQEPVPKTGEAEPEEAAESLEGETFLTLSNGRVEYTFTTSGGALVEARLLEYPERPERGSGPVRLVFRDSPALRWRGMPGPGGPYRIVQEESNVRVAVLIREVGGVQYRRRIELGDGYLLKVRDQWALARKQDRGGGALELSLGRMGYLPGEATGRGVFHLGIDTLSPGGERVRHWGGQLANWFRGDTRGGRPPRSVERRIPEGRPVEWAAVKNKYFVQILRPEGGASGFRAEVHRALDPLEDADPGRRPRVEIHEVGGALVFERWDELVSDGSLTWEFEYYVGPKKYDELRSLAYHRADVMEFGMWGGIGKVLLVTLNTLHRWVPNYGVAIILLTLLIRIVFWPITRVGTRNMRRMQELQPQIEELQRRFKGQPQRLQKELLALYREHRVNPASGCLPMLIQIPVFIALFVVLRSAIELRYAPFLWIRDLSEPENLFAGRLPFGLSLNILPLLMTAMQIWQQKLSPQPGDPAQQKMMTFMPLMMLVFFYNFASGLVLYWTTNQASMVVQQLWYRYERSRGKGARAADRAVGG